MKVNKEDNQLSLCYTCGEEVEAIQFQEIVYWLGTISILPFSIKKGRSLQLLVKVTPSHGDEFILCTKCSLKCRLEIIKTISS